MALRAVPDDGASERRQEELVEREHKDLAAMYRSEAPRLARYFQLRFQGREDPDDLVQELFARLAAGRPFEELRDPTGYLKRIMRNFLIDRNRRQRGVPGFVPMDGIEPAVPPEQAHEIEMKQTRERYRAAVDALPPRTREVFLMHRVEEQSVKIIAERLGISTRTVEWHLAQAIIRIGQALERE
ncbi:RNA polymerase sigma-70 factor (ECF subfamily) [Sphingobium sp. B2D3A]|uniref:RNA polymerase sigma factor n=1 Tax=unclassified Sphingobium TaxID=2611147 RepID=UPI00222422BB|nr:MULTISPECIES: sigma-70 family RNA polymerase sigma factor [unclassified Sphingobium]MCW2338179.1 RNA polymerase sigma-70 factor (ECF subfamily) [Sphingobium sp. B2D3A]MCW2384638.1 RNA polymerase sigma-70 factor (ECF subfamily) [Sphingobium sp. B2D3D]